MTSPEELLVEGSRAASFILSPAVLLIYDYLLTFEREVSLIWCSPRSIVKTLFLLTRYTPFVGLSTMLYYVFSPTMSAGACRATMYLSQWSVFIGIITSEGILLMRTWALWNRNTQLAIAMGVVTFGAAVGSITLLVLWENTLVFSTDLDTSKAGRYCYIVHESGLYAAAFGVIITLETLVITLTVIRMTRQYHILGKVRFQSEFVTVLYRDGVLFFVYMFLMSIINITVILSAKGLDQNLLVVLQQVLHSILSARVLLHLREVQRSEQTTQSVSDVAFAPPSRLVTSSATDDGP